MQRRIQGGGVRGCLNESPSEKEGKFFRDALKDEYNPKPQ